MKGASQDEVMLITEHPNVNKKHHGNPIDIITIDPASVKVRKVTPSHYVLVQA